MARQALGAPVRLTGPGAVPAAPVDFGTDPTGFTRAGAVTFFWGRTLGEGREPWRSDGTAAGTFLLLDLWPGAYGSWYPGRDAFAALNGKVYFAADDGSHGLELWSSDGTSASTVQVNDLCVFELCSLYTSPVVFNGALYFIAGLPHTLYRSDGTAAGTSVVAVLTMDGDGATPHPLVVANGRIYFTLSTFATGDEPWVSDGTMAGTRALGDLAPGSMGSGSDEFIAAGSLVYFVTSWNGGEGLYRTDGTPAGTVMLLSGTVRNLSAFGARLLFSSYDVAAGVELWTSDGTDAGTARALDLYPGPTGSSPGLAVTSGGAAYFAAESPAAGRELWRWDGDSGATLVADFAPGSQSSDPKQLAVLGRAVLFAARGPGGQGLFVTDGTDAGTRAIGTDGGPFDALSATSLFDGFHVTTANEAWFGGFKLTTGGEPWKTDGTPAGTALVANTVGVDDAVEPQGLAALGGKLYFFGRSPQLDFALHESDGTRAGTRRVYDFAPGSGGLPQLGFATAHGQLYFVANTVLGTELWRSDGTAAGTGLVEELTPDAGGTSFLRVAESNGRLYVSAASGVTGNFSSMWWTARTRACGCSRSSPTVATANPTSSPRQARGRTSRRPPPMRAPACGAPTALLRARCGWRRTSTPPG